MPYKNKADQTARNKRYREANKEKLYQIERKQLARLEAIKTASPCMDCLTFYPAECMDFDHRPEEVKYAGVGHLVAGRYSWNLIEKEMTKCDLVCANCHRIRTKARHRSKRVPCQDTI
jgi:hypothetical protein